MEQLYDEIERRAQHAEAELRIAHVKLRALEGRSPRTGRKRDRTNTEYSDDEAVPPDKRGTSSSGKCDKCGGYLYKVAPSGSLYKIGTAERSPAIYRAAASSQALINASINASSQVDG
jgi:hypothetical protein